jgi:7-cyano-7-deazaguanine synthase
MTRTLPGLQIGGFSLASDPAVVVLSGGQDSVTCLGLAIARKHPAIYAISFRYGQKHATELAQAELVAALYGIPFKLVDLSFFGAMVTSELTKADGNTMQPHAYKPGLPASFVPNRNALFLTLAHAYAQEVGATTIYTGVCQTDYSGYPDCRAEFIDALSFALNVGYETGIQIVTPMMHLTKGETFALADTVGFLDVVVEHSHTCYNGDRSICHAWGYGCGKCPACDLRAKGFDDFKAATNGEPHSGEMADMVEAIKHHNV